MPTIEGPSVRGPEARGGRRRGDSVRLQMQRQAQGRGGASGEAGTLPRAERLPELPLQLYVVNRQLEHRLLARRAAALLHPVEELGPNDDLDSNEERDEGCEGLLSQTKAAMLNIFRSIPTEMDFKGQKLAEQIFQGIIFVSAVIGFIYGYITEEFGWTVYIFMAGFVLSCLLTLPPWPVYRRNPLRWLPVQEGGTEEKKQGDRKPKRHVKN